MPWNATSLEALSLGRGGAFPAFLTARGGVSKRIVDLMRPLFNAGVKPESFARLILELQTKAHARRHIEYEHALTTMRASPDFPKSAVLAFFSTFGDQSKYAGVVPNGAYFASIYEKFHASIAQHLDTEVKKRGAERLHWDVSYKEAKHLARYHGESIFKGLVTATNEVGEIRIQFHIVTDGFDQFTTPLEQFLVTMNAHGHNPTELLGTDNPSRDAAFFLDKLPSLRAKQAEFNSMASGGRATSGNSGAGSSSYFTIEDPSVVEVLSAVAAINSKVTPPTPLHPSHAMLSHRSHISLT